MLILGLTGNIACGKSTVAKLLTQSGAAVIDADLLVHELYSRPDFAARVAALFDQPILATDGSIDRGLLGAIVFHDKEAMGRLEALVHPAVAALRDHKLKNLAAAEPAPPVVVVEAVKLIESGQGASCDVVWCVTCKPETQLRRLMESRGLERDDAATRIERQPSFEAKRSLLGAKPLIVIENDGSVEELTRRVEQEWRSLVTTQEATAEIDFHPAHESQQDVAATGEGMMPEEFADIVARLIRNIEQVIVGKTDVVEGCLIGMLSGGHVLLEDVPGVGKTTLAKSLARSLGVTYKRIQFTPDLLPSDVTGTVVFDQTENRFNFREGPIFAHVVLADEINRASPKTQSALLECMEEGQVTADLRTHSLPKPFFVIATQNPSEYEGVYPLPESQLDRFAMRLAIGYPSAEAEKLLMKQQRVHHPIENLASVTEVGQIKAMQHVVRQIAIHDSIYEYVLRLAQATRQHRQLMLGLSPRGALTLTRTAQARAAARGRKFVTPDDVKAVAVPVMSHRLIPYPEARLSGFSTERLVNELLQSVALTMKK